MLVHLTIENFAIIDRIDLDLGPGLVALTGETGAGKSIVIDAVGGVLGQRLGPDVIRAGADAARIEAIIAMPPITELRDLLEEFGIPEAMWHLQTEGFVAVVTMDSHGNSLHADIEEESGRKLDLLAV